MWTGMYLPETGRRGKKAPFIGGKMGMGGERRAASFENDRRRIAALFQVKEREREREKMVIFPSLL